MEVLPDCTLIQDNCTECHGMVLESTSGDDKGDPLKRFGVLEFKMY